MIFTSALVPSCIRSLSLFILSRALKVVFSSTYTKAWEYYLQFMLSSFASHVNPEKSVIKINEAFNFANWKLLLVYEYSNDWSLTSESTRIDPNHTINPWNIIINVKAMELLLHDSAFPLFTSRKFPLGSFDTEIKSEWVQKSVNHFLSLVCCSKLFQYVRNQKGGIKIREAWKKKLSGKKPNKSHNNRK